MSELELAFIIACFFWVGLMMLLGLIFLVGYFVWSAVKKIFKL